MLSEPEPSMHIPKVYPERLWVSQPNFVILIGGVPHAMQPYINHNDSLFRFKMQISQHTLYTSSPICKYIIDKYGMILVSNTNRLRPASQTTVQFEL